MHCVPPRVGNFCVYNSPPPPPYSLLALERYPKMARPERSRLEVWQQFLRAHQRVLGVLGDELEQERGLPLAWYEVLLHVGRAPDRRLRMGDLANAVVLSTSALT